MKRCSRCGESKPTADFYRNRGWKDGLHPYCKVCLLAYQADRWRRFGIRKTARRWASTGELRHDYFAKIDTPTKAYLLGLLAADGCVSGHPGWNRVYLEVSVRDRALVELVQTEIASSVQIRERTRDGRTNSIIAFSSMHLKADLVRHGVVPLKTYLLTWPNDLPSRLEWAFVLGYFDGDGWFSLDPRGSRLYPHWRLLGTFDFLVSVSLSVQRHLGIACRSPLEKTGCFLLAKSGPAARLIDAWMHQNPVLGLDRKRLSLMEAAFRR